MKNLKLVFALFSAAWLLNACSGDKDEPSQTPTPTPTQEQKVESKTGEISYEVSSGSGEIPSSQVVVNGEPLNMTISQKSSYTDPNGKVYTCEPEANISMTVAKDTIHVKDLATLTSVKQNGDPTTSSNGTNPVLNKIGQTFDIGGQEVSFDLGYEVYRYTTSTNTTIEMPYIKLNPAQYGDAQAAETRGVAALTSITLTPLNKAAETRSVVIKDTAMFKVDVSFKLDIETKHTKEDSTTPLSFKASFVGVVENVTELPDPTSNLSYQLSILGGTKSTASPFTVTSGEQLSLEWGQASQYTYFSAKELNGKTIDKKLKATVKLQAEKDVVWVSSADNIDQVSEQTPSNTSEGKDPTRHIGKQTFTIGGQNISLERSYENYGSITVEGKGVNLPYLEIGEAQVVDVSKTELQGDAVPENAIKAFEVTVRFSQQLSANNVAEKAGEMVEYVVKYTVAVGEPKLLSTIYEKDYMWDEPDLSCGLPWRYRYIVRRVRTYSTGATEVDTFTGLTTSHVILSAGIDPSNEVSSLVYHNQNEDAQNDDFQRVITTKVGVPDLSSLSCQLMYDRDPFATDRNFSDYVAVLKGNARYNPNNPEEWWYTYGFMRSQEIRFFSENTFFDSDLAFNVNDYFLYIDGQIIDFSDYWMTYNFDFREERITMPNGAPAKVFTHDCKAKYLGREFYVATIDTVYQLK